MIKTLEEQLREIKPILFEKKKDNPPTEKNGTT